MLKPTLQELIRSSLRSIVKNKSRTILTSLGIIIGVTSVILLTSIGNGLKSYINGQFESLGSNLVFIAPGKIFDDTGNFNRNGASSYITTSFTQKDYRNIQKELKDSIVLPANMLPNVEIKYRNITVKEKTLIGSSENYGKELNSLPSEGNGTWFTKEDNEKNANVVVLGHKVAQDLFGEQNPIGKKILINSKNFKVIGVVDKKGSSFGGPDDDNQIYTPFNTVSAITGNEEIQEIVVRVSSQANIEDAKEKIKEILMEKYKEDAFSVFDSSQLLNSINSIISVLTIGLTGIAAISLIVGGIGIMNIMLVSVTERTREIGLRKAIGAYPRAILIQFLIEAVILSCLGGLFGILLGFLGTLAINPFFPAKLTLSSVILAFGVSSIVGIVFGVAPANKASKLSPIEALRYE
jgi:putative ABC transport system permease protein